MGIVSYCPSGHRIKVKDQLAGKKGVCPTCGARFRIPLASVEEPPRPIGPAAVEVSLPVAAVVSLDPQLAATLPRALPLAAPALAATIHEAPTTSSFEPEAEIVVEFEPAEVVLPAVIEEAPAAAWCIAVPGGSPSQPMAGEDLFRWLSSGEATGAELVWRSDWSDWRPARDVFPEQLPGAGGIAGW